MIKIAVVGTRGFPGVQGGVESHCEHLYPQLAKLGCDVTVFTRRSYVDEKIETYDGVKLVSLDCPRSKYFEAILHTFRGIVAARSIGANILHIHAIGPALLVPLARILGFKVVITHHGPDYKRKKWNAFAKSVLLAGEILGTNFANMIICISQVIADDVKKKTKRPVRVIPNGINIKPVLEQGEALKKYSLSKGKYIFTAGRLVPEKGFDSLVRAFGQVQLGGWKLVVAGAADHETPYSRSLIKEADENPDIVFTGFLSGVPLQELYSNAGLFVLPSYYEGLPIALLEAMSYGILCIASDIPANRCVALPEENYFQAGNIDKLSEKIIEFSGRTLAAAERSAQEKLLREKYSWSQIAVETLDVYKDCMCE
jgi:glycosyltransferase involved in cell wall biosynthesis